MKSQRIFRVLTVAALIGGASLAISGSPPTSAAASPVMLAEFTWTGAATDDLFSSHCNWHPGPTCSLSDPVPDGTDDNATFPDNSGAAWAVDATDATIGDLTLNEDVDFDVASGTHTLTLNKLVIVGDDDAGTVVTMTGNADITIAP